ncbi:MAG: molybdate ABC transporter substrate-binding protein [Sulfolobales archaeon]
MRDLCKISIVALSSALILVLVLFLLINPFTLSSAGSSASVHVIRVYAAPVVARYIDNITPIFEEWAAARGLRVKIEVTYGASGTLLNRINISREGDVYIPADSDWILRASRSNLIYGETIRVLSWQIIAIITPKGNPAKISTIHDLARPGLKIAIPDPVNAPAGRIALEILRKKNLYDSVKNNLVILPDIAQVTKQILSKSVDAALAWSSIHSWYPNETEIIWLDQSDLVYSSCVAAAVLKTTSNYAIARLFVEFLVDYLRENRDWAARNGYIVDRETLRIATPYTSIPGDEFKLCGSLG